MCVLYFQPLLPAHTVLPSLYEVDIFRYVSLMEDNVKVSLLLKKELLLVQLIALNEIIGLYRLSINCMFSLNIFYFYNEEIGLGVS